MRSGGLNSGSADRGMAPMMATSSGKNAGERVASTGTTGLEFV
jgi:hypothetical protein